MTATLTVLPNSLRILTDPVPGVESVALGAYFACGTRHENLAENGMAHLVEHMMFKGTRTRTAQQIAETIEGLGGMMNAYTSREVTGYYFHILKDDVATVLEVLADMIQHSVFDAGELDRERGVILQEIGMTQDTPDDLVFDHFQTTAWPGQTLGAPILGTVPIIQSTPAEQVAAYVRQHYTPKNLVISAAGGFDPDVFIHHVTQLFTDLPTDQTHTVPPATYHGGVLVDTKDLEQAHLVMGFRGIPRTDPRYYNMVALAHILGGGMSSRLFQNIREQRGLAYNIHAFHSAYMDDGILGVYAGTGPDQIDELMNAVADELGRIKNPVADHELARTCAQLKASLLMGRENMSTRADQNAKHLIFHNRVLQVDDLRARIEAIDAAIIADLAATVLSGPPTIVGLGPMTDLPQASTWHARMAA